nr:UPF0488 protein CG14286 [Nomia melanderi]
MPSKPKPNKKKQTNPKKNVAPAKVGSAGGSSEHKNVETSSGLTQEAEDQFELELCWCIQQLETCLATGKLPEKQTQDLNKNINILKSNTAPLVKKRQIMRNSLGDYREKMALDQQKHGKSASSLKFVSTSKQNEKCLFVKKAACNITKLKKDANNDVVSSNANNNSNNDTETEFKFNFQITE